MTTLPLCACGCGRWVPVPRRGFQGRFFSAACRSRAARRRLVGAPEDTPPVRRQGRRAVLRQLAESHTHTNGRSGTGERLGNGFLGGPGR